MIHQQRREHAHEIASALYSTDYEIRVHGREAVTTQVTIRKATTRDIAFLVEAVVSAEKSGTASLGLATVSGLSEAEVKTALASIFEEESTNFELSVSSFLIAEVDGRPAATVESWHFSSRRRRGAHAQRRRRRGGPHPTHERGSPV